MLYICFTCHTFFLLTFPSLEAWSQMSNRSQLEGTSLVVVAHEAHTFWVCVSMRNLQNLLPPVHLGGFFFKDLFIIFAPVETIPSVKSEHAQSWLLPVGYFVFFISWLGGPPSLHLLLLFGVQLLLAKSHILHQLSMGLSDPQMNEIVSLPRRVMTQHEKMLCCSSVQKIIW